MLFSNIWLKAINKKAEDLESNPTDYTMTMAAALVAAVVLAAVMAAFGETTIVGGILTGFVIGIGFNLTATLAYSLFEGPGIPVWLIYSGYQLLGLAMMGAIIGAF